MDKAILQTWLGQYLPEVVTGFDQIANGFANDSFLVACKSGQRYVVRRLRAQAISSAEAEARIQKALNMNGVTSPVYMRLHSGDIVGRDSRNAFTIAPYIDGTTPSIPTLGLTRSLGKTLATIHNILDPTIVAIPNNTAQWLNVQNATAEIERCDNKNKDKLRSLMNEGYPVFHRNLPKAIIHGDLTLENIFAKNDTVTAVFDFETAEHALRIIDIATTYLSIADHDHIDPSLARKELLESYDTATRRKLTPTEKDSFHFAVKHAAAATAAWCYNNGCPNYADKYLHTATQLSQGMS